jgi:hypothetical protein
MCCAIIGEEKPVLVTRQLELSASGSGYIQLIKTDETTIINIGCIHMNAINDTARVQNK